MKEEMNFKRITPIITDPLVEIGVIRVYKTLNCFF